ncbi:MAG TPA: hypothetical protein GXX18_08310 [Bacillales bacterium]|nr:hypothetical protein [Bacillales bacterium]
MSERKEAKVIHVDKLIIHAKEVEIIHERNEEQQHHHRPRRPRRDPWGFFWGGPQAEQDVSNESHEERHNDQ